MKTLRDLLPFVKGQLEFHKKRSKHPDYSADRQKLHAGTAETLQELLDAMEASPISVPSEGDPLTLLPNDLTGLPPELLHELNISEGDKVDAMIVEIINAAGGTLLLDKILIGLYKNTKEVHQRQQVISRIYRMSKRGLVKSVPRKKGVYTTLPIEEGEETES